MLRVVRHLIRLRLLLDAWVLHLHSVMMVECWVISEPMLEAHRSWVEILQVWKSWLSSIRQPTAVVSAAAVVNQLCLVRMLMREVQVVVQLPMQTFVHDHAERVLVRRHLVHTLAIVDRVAQGMGMVVSSSIVLSVGRFQETLVAGHVLFAFLTRRLVYVELVRGHAPAHDRHRVERLVVRVPVHILVVAISDLQQP